jgi:hypothetical protein
MKLVILHEQYKEYYIVHVPNLQYEAIKILNSLYYKI